MFKVIYTNKIIKDIKLAQKRGLKLEKFKNMVSLLSEENELPKKCKPHMLSGEWNNCWECHIESNWLLIYRFTGEEIHLIRTGTHSDLF